MARVKAEAESAVSLARAREASALAKAETDRKRMDRARVQGKDKILALQKKILVLEQQNARLHSQPQPPDQPPSSPPPLPTHDTPPRYVALLERAAKDVDVWKATALAHERDAGSLRSQVHELKAQLHAARPSVKEVGVQTDPDEGAMALRTKTLRAEQRLEGALQDVINLQRENSELAAAYGQALQDLKDLSSDAARLQEWAADLAASQALP